MKISRAWLQTYFAAPLPDAAHLADALTFHAFEIEGVENDILDVKVTPNRGHDCLSHRGVAKELSAILQIPMKADPLRAPVALAPATDAVSVSIDDPARCRRYVSAYIRGVQVKESPAWLKDALESIGQRSINNVVDATNYVMFSIGQPLHAFDARQLTDDEGRYAIRVRSAREGEAMRALDEKDYVLSASMLLITDANSDAAIGIAGVKGGAPAGITDATRDLIIESANFDGVSVRKTAQALKLRTDASSRFEQQLSAELAAYGMRAVVDLILELAKGELVGFVDVYPTKPEPKRVTVSTAQVNAALGTAFADDAVSQALARLDLPFQEAAGSFTVTVPFERLDLTIAEHLIEEVARIVGYDKVPATPLPPHETAASINPIYAWSEKIREFLQSQGFSEVFTSVFAEAGERVVLNKVDGVRPFLRRDLLAGLRDALERNARMKELLGIPQVRLFELGIVWREGREVLMLGVAVEQVKKQKGAADFLAALAADLGAVSVAAVEGEILEIPLDELTRALPEPQSYDLLPASAADRYRPFSKYPFIVRDIALWVPAGVDAVEVFDVIAAHAGALMVRCDLFDRFEKEGRISYAYRIVFQSMDRTLFDGDANERMESVTAALREKGWEVR